MTARHVNQALRLLDRWGLLMLQDPLLPCVVAVVAGERVRGSWWGHPLGHAMFEVAGAVDDHPDVATAKLVSRKVTFVHRRLWPALIAAGRSREPWQMRGLSPAGRALLARVDAERQLRASGRAAKELEQRLLVASRQVHTEAGAHAVELSTWDAFARARGLRRTVRSPAKARDALEAAVAAVNAEFSARATLPWSARGARSR